MTTATDEQRIAEAIERIASETKPSDDGWDQIQRRIRRDERRRSLRTELLVIAAAVTFLVAAGVVVQREAGGGDVVASGGGRLEFGFEGEPDATLAPPGWDRTGAATGYEFRSVTDRVFAGERAARIRLAAEPEPNGFGALMVCEPAGDFAQKRVRLSGYLATEGAVGRGAGLWLRADNSAGDTIILDNMDDRRVVGDQNFAPAEIVIDVPEHTAQLCFGFLLVGAGTAWADSLVFEVVGDAGEGPAVTAERRLRNTDFELGPAPGGHPVHWGGGGQGFVLEATDAAPHSGHWAGRIRFVRYAGDLDFGVLTQCIDAGPFIGKTVVYTGWLRTTDVAGIGSSLWLRVDGPDSDEEPLFFDNMESRAVKGTTGWQQYEIRGPVDETATEICLGVLLQGEGIVDADELSVAAE